MTPELDKAAEIARLLRLRQEAHEALDAVMDEHEKRLRPPGPTIKRRI